MTLAPDLPRFPATPRTKLFERLLRLQGRASALPTSVQYACVTLLVLAALLARSIGGSDLDGHRFIFFLPAVLISAMLFERGAWLYATLLSATVEEFFFTQPHFGFGFDSLAEVAAASLFVITGAAVAALVAGLRKTAGKLAAANTDLEGMVNRLATAEGQKSMLLSEINHRIKNDLASIGSMLNLQARGHSDASTREALQTAAGRISVLGRVYDRLQLRDQSEAATVDVGEFIGQLCDDLRAGLIGMRPVTLEADVTPKQQLPMSRAVPLGLIINELVTNALKYAFPEERAGSISVSFRSDGETCSLVVSDDGVGLGPSPRAGGLGQRMVAALVRQLEGRSDIVNVSGVAFTLEFPARETMVSA